MRASDLYATCWCERKFVCVTAEEVKAGITHSCGHPDC